ncbi:MAG: sulfotransferase [Desulfarculaceae bacterium]|nr:sulfotransferase [Desulfarculaceae bacterium]
MKQLWGRLQWQSRTRGMSPQEIKQFKRARIIADAMEGKTACPEELPARMLATYRPVREPLYLISQVQRSGGSLLAQLFDGHPECHSHPYEIKIGKPDKTVWPEFSPGEAPEEAFAKLFEHDCISFHRNGYRKPGRGSKAKGQDETFPFFFLVRAQRDIFLHYLAGVPQPRPRDYLDAYWTSYFNAWVNNQNLSGEKKCVLGFTPMLAARPESVEGYFAAYPEGKLVSLIRDPLRWLASARRHQEKYRQTEQAMEYWTVSTQAAIANAGKWPDRVRLYAFERLITDTPAVMRDMCAFLGLRYRDSLLDPTFNRSLIAPNSSFRVDGKGIIKDVVARPLDLEPEAMAYVEEHCRELHTRALALAGA